MINVDLLVYQLRSPLVNSSFALRSNNVVSPGGYNFSQAGVRKANYFAGVLERGWKEDEYGSKDDNKTKQSCVMLIDLPKFLARMISWGRYCNGQRKYFFWSKHSMKHVIAVFWQAYNSCCLSRF